MQRDKINSFSAFISESVKNYANNKALGFINEEYLTYSEMGQKISAVQAFLEKLGIGEGDKVIIYSQNMPTWGVVYFALQCSGIVAVPVLPDFSPVELENVIKHSESKALFISENLQYKLKDTDASSLDIIVTIDDLSLLKAEDTSVVFDENATSKKAYTPKENELAVLIYTSGTTGNSKGVMLSQKNIIANVVQSGAVQKITEDFRFLSVLPLSHTYENTIGFLLAIYSGASVTYLRKPPTASVLLPALKSLRPTIILTVPMIIEKIYKNSILPGINKKAFTRVLHRFRPTRKLVHRLAGKKLMETFGGRIQFFGIGGAKLDGKVERFLRDAKFPYAIGYGLTETSPLIAGSNPTTTRFRAIGPKVINCELKIHDPNPATGEGEIWAKGPNVMLGYYKNPEETKRVLTDDGWFKTGDLGVFDKDGWLSHKGRLKNMIVGANGENIYPEEIESIINNFRHVVESVVIEKKGQLVALVHFNREELEQKVREMRSELGDRMDEISQHVDEKIDELSVELKDYINSRVNKFSKVQQFISHPTPFIKTATQKIKRYLYH
ncbi:AMP-binding protein [Draconibacterium halophilum]|uniref:Long-chain fatty acid--CoA ligase n=1 Tax=Draconibacterium halophilum TaxID=2706887 RepID=A0A6C0RGQ5_9BACT|nr:AMP-binding protein [Draconibacterium halophilum]QIA09176.1 long-chain fatty acid--CoA ligase [Draconibacterium halophilum]